MIRSLALAGLLVVGLLGGLPAVSPAQVFMASRPNPPFTIGPLNIRASVSPEMAHLPIDITWSLVIPEGTPAAAAEGDLFLLWPSELLPETGLGPPDPTLARYVEDRGFASIEEGRIALTARKLSTSADRKQETLPGGAPFVTFVRQGPQGLTSPASYVRIPWDPRMAESGWLMRLTLKTKGLIKKKPNTWTERAFWGPRSRLLLSFQDVNSRGLFTLYFERRAHVVRLAEDPAQLGIDFAQADHLKIDELQPPAARRQLSETRDNTDTVRLFLDRSEGITPQTLTVQFGYFSDLQSWAPILIPIAFFALGNLAAPVFRLIGLRLARAFRARVHVGSPDRATVTAGGVVLGAETLARIRANETTAEEVRQLLGPPTEEVEQLGGPGKHTLVYRSRRLTPQRGRSWGWIATVDHWEEELQEVDIALDGGVVSNVQARVRRTRLAHPDAE
ncbi:MAG TPA: hypothetical protein VK548_13365 [Candidatus Acidoferrum sp.]|nr:hypothetical protein [Candidatus Acidoferrum sp.]